MSRSTIEIFEKLEQGTPEWVMARLGIPTASRFSDVMAEGKGITRQKYLRQLAGERVSGIVEEGYKNAHMARGNAMEDEIRRSYALLRDVEPVRVGFVKNHGAGASPDSFVGPRGGVEFKSAQQSVMVELIEKADKDPAYFPSEHVAQVQGNLWVTEREWWDLVIYCPGLPMVVRRAQRDVAMIARIAREVARFNEDLSALVARIRAFT